MPEKPKACNDCSKNRQNGEKGMRERGKTRKKLKEKMKQRWKGQTDRRLLNCNVLLSHATCTFSIFLHVKTENNDFQTSTLISQILHGRDQ